MSDALERVGLYVNESARTISIIDPEVEGKTRDLRNSSEHFLDSEHHTHTHTLPDHNCSFGIDI